MIFMYSVKLSPVRERPVALMANWTWSSVRTPSCERPKSVGLMSLDIFFRNQYQYEPFSKLYRTRLTYNCAHLRSTKESLTIFWVKIFLSENFLGEFFLVKIFWGEIFFGENLSGENFFG